MKALLTMSLFISFSAMASSPTVVIKKAYGGNANEGDTPARSGALDAASENKHDQEVLQKMEEKHEKKKKEKEKEKALRNERDSMNTAPIPSATPSSTPAPTSP